MAHRYGIGGYGQQSGKVVAVFSCCEYLLRTRSGQLHKPFGDFRIAVPLDRSLIGSQGRTAQILGHRAGTAYADIVYVKIL